MEATRAPVKNSTDASESSRGQDSARVTTASPTTISRAACLSCRSLAWGRNRRKYTSSANRSAVDANRESRVEVSEANTTTNTKAAPPAPSRSAAITGKTMFTCSRGNSRARATRPMEPVTIGTLIQAMPPKTKEVITTERRLANTRDHQMLL